MDQIIPQLNSAYHIEQLQRIYLEVKHLISDQYRIVKKLTSIHTAIDRRDHVFTILGHVVTDQLITQ